MKICLSMIAALALVGSSSAGAFADSGPAAPIAPVTGPLAPGSAAGVKQAQLFGGVPVWVAVLGAGAIIGGVAFAVTEGHHHSTTSTTAP
jgi:hypothetical protein